MKHLSRALLDLLKATLLLAVIGIGASTLSARYSTSVVSAPSWTPPSANPPNNNAPAPINVSMNAQQKSGSLILGTTAGVDFDNPLTSLDVFGLASTTILSTDYLLVGKDFTYAKGTNLAGKVLTSDASGTASWQTPAGGGGGATGAGIHFITPIDLGTIPRSWFTYVIADHPSSGIPADAKAVLVWVGWNSGYCENCSGTMYGESVNGNRIPLLTQSSGGRNTATPSVGVQAWVPVINGSIKLLSVIGDGKSAGSMGAGIYGYMK